MTALDPARTIREVTIGDCRLILGDCLEVLPTIEKGSVGAVVTDPPYCGVVSETWDNQWQNNAAYIEWLRGVVSLCSALMEANASLYLFASNRLAAYVEVMVGESLNVLSSITWSKGDRRNGAAGSGIEVGALRTYWQSASERIIFAEHFNSDNAARGEAGYVQECDKLRGFVFEPIRAYLDSERERAGVSVRKVAELFQQKTGSRTVTGMAGHWFGRVQWSFPTSGNYYWLRGVLNNGTTKHLRRDYEDLRRDYEDLRRDYEDLRRPFFLCARDQWTNVWKFAPPRKSCHPCEKPIPLLLHILKASTRQQDTILDPFMGSGTTGVACVKLGRQFIGIEIEPKYFDIACKRIEEAYADTALFDGTPERKERQIELFQDNPRKE